jgi:hypothetical protein
MSFDEILVQVLDLLQREKRLSYRALKVRSLNLSQFVEDQNGLHTSQILLS